jgi:hypothetical protein
MYGSAITTGLARVFFPDFYYVAGIFFPFELEKFLESVMRPCQHSSGSFTSKFGDHMGSLEKRNINGIEISYKEIRDLMMYFIYKIAYFPSQPEYSFSYTFFRSIIGFGHLGDSLINTGTQPVNTGEIAFAQFAMTRTGIV